MTLPSMEQHPIPQNVTTFQFRLIGDMTIKQFGYLAVGAILAYISYKLPLPFFFTWPMTLFFALGGFGLAFVPVEDRPMDVWVLSFFRNIYSPTLFIWEKSKPPVKPPVIPKTIPPTSSLPVTPPSPIPAPQKIPTAVPPPVAITPPVVTFSSIVMPKAEPKPVHQPVPHPPASVGSPHNMSWIEMLLGGLTHARQDTHPKTPLPATKRMDVVPRPSPRAPQQDAFAGHIVKQQADSLFAWFMKLFTQSPPPPKKPLAYAPGALFSATPLTSVTGTRINPMEQQIPVKPKPPDGNTPTQQQLEAAKELNTKINKLEGELKTKEGSEARVLELQKQLTAALSQSAKNEAELNRLRQQAQVRPAPQIFRPAGVVPPMASGVSPTVRIVPQESATKLGLPHQTAMPSIITGVVKDDANNLLPNVLITVRDKDDVPLRALKSNRLGQFAASTPLSDGTYIIEVEDPRGRYAFDRVQITLNSNVLPAIEIIAKNQKRLDREKLAAQVFGTQA